MNELVHQNGHKIFLCKYKETLIDTPFANRQMNFIFVDSGLGVKKMSYYDFQYFLFFYFNIKGSMNKTVLGQRPMKVHDDDPDTICSYETSLPVIPTARAARASEWQNFRITR
jgi:hypothetical protein